MSKLNFAVVISKYYASRCASLINSILKYNVKIYVLCFDEETIKIINEEIFSAKVVTISYNKVLKFDQSLKKIIKKRKLIDKIVTSRPIFLKYLYKEYKIDSIFLLDSDICFFSNPNLMIKYIKDASVAYCKHNFSRNSKVLSNKYGKYNGGFVYIKNDQNGKKFLKIWSKLCKKWCEFDPKQGKFSDQKYLEDLPTKVKKLKILNCPEINLAPWNLEGKKIFKKNNTVYVNKKKLIFFHFHGLRKITKNFFILGLENYNFRLSNEEKKIIFYNYAKKLSETAFTKEYFWDKNNFFSRLFKIYVVLIKIFKNDYLILFK